MHRADRYVKFPHPAVLAGVCFASISPVHARWGTVHLFIRMTFHNGRVCVSNALRAPTKKGDRHVVVTLFGARTQPYLKRSAFNSKYSAFMSVNRSCFSGTSSSG